MVERLFNIKRCIIDVNHQIIRHNHEVHAPSTCTMKLKGFALRLFSCFRDVAGDDSTTSKDDDNVNSKESRKENTSDGTVEQIDETVQCCWPSEVDVEQAKNPPAQVVSPSSLSLTTKQSEDTEIDPSHPAHPEHEREVLNVYGKFLTLNKKRNTLVILLITATVISAVIIAGFAGCFMVGITVYEDGPCPYYGIMDCYYGNNQTYFQCTPNISITLPGSKSAACFRWIGRDITVSDVMTQVGACTGLLTALGAVLEVFIRFLYFILQQRLCVSTGIRRVMEKTAGINRFTQPSHCCCCTIPHRLGVLDLRLYEHPILVVIVFIIYAMIPIDVAASIFLMINFRISITSLTYVVMATLVLISCMGLLWILWEENEIDQVIPGAWNDINDTVASMKNPFSKLKPLLESIIPKEDMEKFKHFVDHELVEARSHINSKLNEINQYTTNVMDEITKQIENKFPIEKMERLKPQSNDIRSIVKNFSLQGSAQEIKSKIETEKEKDIRNRKT
ncbi:unnamed protein product [Adineta steineri]|uniref:Uncharacterized protein n=1 Tax=Adineta steineri TaxID=433720 RepID=A0A815WKY5_9BILA|nr:unnamed protein product [Adineta steineri]CAF1658922.1 unnamed protein product [Adineta steineri]